MVLPLCDARGLIGMLRVKQLTEVPGDRIELLGWYVVYEDKWTPTVLGEQFKREYLTLSGWSDTPHYYANRSDVERMVKEHVT